MGWAGIVPSTLRSPALSTADLAASARAARESPGRPGPRLSPLHPSCRPPPPRPPHSRVPLCGTPTHRAAQLREPPRQPRLTEPHNPDEPSSGTLAWPPEREETFTFQADWSVNIPRAPARLAEGGASRDVRASLQTATGSGTAEPQVPSALRPNHAHGHALVTRGPFWYLPRLPELRLRRSACGFDTTSPEAQSSPTGWPCAVVICHP